MEVAGTFTDAGTFNTTRKFSGYISQQTMSDHERLSAIPMVAIKMFKILLADSLGYLLQGADLATQCRPLEVVL